MGELEDYFLKNLSYCVTIKRRKQGYSIYEPEFEKKVEYLNQIKNDVLKTSGKETLLIYYFFLDKDTKDSFQKLFKKITYDEFSEYFDNCLKRAQKTGVKNLNKIEFINLFHLIGTIRLLKDYESKSEEIEEILENILSEPHHVFPSVIKYSAQQIFVNIFFKEKDSLDLNRYQNFIASLTNEIDENTSLTRFIALYSFFYYDFGKTEKEIISEYIKKITERKKLFLKNLHQYLPQIQSLIIRQNYLNKNINSIFKELYSVSKTSQMNETKKMLNDLIRESM